MGNSLAAFDSVKKKEGLPIHLRGVRLQVAKDILNELRAVHEVLARQKLGRDPSPGEVIVQAIVKEKAVGNSFAEYLSQTPSTATLVGPCNVFLSHT